MPYINLTTRLDYNIHIRSLVHMLNQHGFRSGDLNYVITMLLLETKPQTYEQFNALVGVLESCKLEFYRAAVGPYEDRKAYENGDVYIDNEITR